MSWINSNATYKQNSKNDLSFYHGFSKTPVEPTSTGYAATTLANASTKSGHTVMATEVWAEEIPWYGLVPSKAVAVTRLSGRTNKNDLVKVDGDQTYIYIGEENAVFTAENWSDFWEPLSLTNGLILKNRHDKPVLKYYLQQPMQPLTTTNNAAIDSKGYATRLFVNEETNVGVTTGGSVVSQFVAGTDNIKNGIPSVELNPVLYYGTTQKIAGTHYYDYNVSGTVLWNENVTSRGVKITCFRYIGKVVTDSVAAIQNEIDVINEQLGTGSGDNSISSRLTALEDVVGDSTDGLVKDVADNTAAIATKASQSALTTAEGKITTAEGKITTLEGKVAALETGKLTYQVVESLPAAGSYVPYTIYLVKDDDAEAGSYIEWLAIDANTIEEIGSTETDLSGYTTDAEHTALAGRVTATETAIGNSTSGLTKAVADAKAQADKGVADAKAAQTTANTAVTDAATAQTTANEAKAAAATNTTAINTLKGLVGETSVSSQITAATGKTISNSDGSDAEHVTVTLGGTVGSPTVTVKTHDIASATALAGVKTTADTAVQKVTEGKSTENFVSLTVSRPENSNDVTVTIDDTGLKTKIDAIETSIGNTGTDSLGSRLTTAEGDIDTLQKEMDAVEGVAGSAVQSVGNITGEYITATASEDATTHAVSWTVNEGALKTALGNKLNTSDVISYVGDGTVKVSEASNKQKTISVTTADAATAGIVTGTSGTAAIEANDTASDVKVATVASVAKSLSATKTAYEAYADQAEADAISAAATTAQSKADAAQAAAKEYTDTAIAGTTGSLTTHTGNTDIHVTTSDKSSWNTAATKAGTAIQGVGSITGTKYIKATANESTAHEITWTVDETALTNELDAKATTTALTTHTGNGDIHVTAAQKTDWDGAVTKANAAATQTDLDALAGRVGTAEGKITTLEGDMTTVKSDISTLSGKAVKSIGVTDNATHVTLASGKIDGNGNVQLTLSESDIASATDLSNLTNTVNTHIADAAKIGIEIAAAVSETDRKPNVTSPSTGKIYLVPATEAEGEVGGTYVEWIYTNNKWVRIGTTATDLTKYAKTADVTSAINAAKTAASNDATSKANAAQTAAEKTASDALSAATTELEGKIATAKTEAITAANAYTTEQIATVTGNANALTTRVSTLETEVNTNIPKDIADAQAAAEATAAADATTKANKALADAKTYADTAEADAIASAKAYTDERETAITTAYEAADTALETAYKAADTKIRTDFAAADTAITNAYKAADTQIRTDFAAADTATLTSAKEYTNAEIDKISLVKSVNGITAATTADGGAAVTIDAKNEANYFGSTLATVSTSGTTVSVVAAPAKEWAVGTTKPATSITSVIDGKASDGSIIDIANLTDGTGMFADSSIKTFIGDMPKLTTATNMFSGSGLTSFCGNLGSVTNAEGMFSGCKLDLESVIYIVDSLPAHADEKTHTINIGVDSSLVSQDDINELTAELSSKGWGGSVTAA